MSHKATHIVLIGVGLLSVIFMRKLHELKEISYLFMVAMIVFVLMVLAELFSFGLPEDFDYESITQVKKDRHLITAINIIAFAYNV